MTSKFDQPDTDPMDQWEEKPLDVQDEPADGEPWQSARKCSCWLGTTSTFGSSVAREQCAVHGLHRYPDPPIDPAEHAYHSAIDAFATLEVELAKCSDTKRAWVLRRLTQALDRRATDVMQAAASKLDDLVS